MSADGSGGWSNDAADAGLPIVPDLITLTGDVSFTLIAPSVGKVPGSSIPGDVSEYIARLGDPSLAVLWRNAAIDALGPAPSTTVEERNGGLNDNFTGLPVSHEPAAGPATAAVVVWVERMSGADTGATGNDAAAIEAAREAGFGPVMMRRLDAVARSDGAIVGFSGEGSNVVRLSGGFSGAANDNTVWVGDEEGSGQGGVIGRDPQGLVTVHGDTIVTWIGLDGKLDGKAYAGGAAEQADDAATDIGGKSPHVETGEALTALLADIPPFQPGQRYRIAENGRDGFSIVWAAAVAGAVIFSGREITPPNEYSGTWVARDLGSAPAAPGTRIDTDFKVLGWSAETGTLTVAYEMADGADGSRWVETVGLGAEEAAAPAASDTASVAASGSSGVYLPALKASAASAAAEGDGSVTEAAQATAPGVEKIASIHAGIVENANLIVGDQENSNDLDGTDSDDVMIGGKAADDISGGASDDVIFGDGGDDNIDGGGDSDSGPSIDTAVLSGDARDYSITANGDGTYTVVYAASDNGVEADRSTAGSEGVDTTKGIEQYQFLDGDTAYIAAIVSGADIASLDTSGHDVVQASDLYQLPTDRNAGSDLSGDGTPIAWGLERHADGSVDNTVAVTEFAGTSGAPAAPAVAATGDGGFAVAWVEDGAVNVKRFDALGQSEATPDGADCITLAGTANADVAPVADSSGHGVAVAAVGDGDDGGGTIHVHTIGHDAGGDEVLTLALTTSDVVAEIAIAGGAEGGHITVAWTETSGHEDDRDGDILVQRVEVGEGALTTAGLDGDPSNGSNGAEVIGRGHAVAATDTAGDGFAVAWVAEETATGSGPSGGDAIDGRIFDYTGLVIEEFQLLIAAGHSLREGTGPSLETTGSGDLFLAWQEIDTSSGGLSVMSALLRQLGDKEWTKPIIKELKHFDKAPGEVSIAIAGDNGDAVILTWSSDGEGGGEIVGQRFSIDAIAADATDTAVGVAFTVAEGADAEGTSVVGLDDGRVVVVVSETSSGDGEGNSRDGDDPSSSITVQAVIFDTRDPDAIITSDAGGASADSHVGTIGDDVVDGRSGQDELFGALGDDVLTGGIGDDHLDGGNDDDTLLGGSGSDRLKGGDGDDLLMGGFGRDYISGGAGIDTLSYRGESRAVDVDLAAGTVRSDAAHNAVADQSTEKDIEGISRSTFLDRGVEDLIGGIENNNCGKNGTIEFAASGDIENVEGGLGSDTLRGDAADNVLTGGKGDDVLDGRGGIDTARYSGAAADYDVTLGSDGTIEVRHARNTSTQSNDGTDRVTGVEFIEFSDGRFALGTDGSVSPQGVAAALGITSEISTASLECFAFVDLDDLEDLDDHDSSQSSVSSSNDGNWDDHDSDEDLCGLGSDTMYFADLDALFDNSGSGKSLYDDFDDDDGLDYSSCTIFADQDAIAAALSLDGPDTLDTVFDGGCSNLRTVDDDQQDHKII